MPWLLTTVLLAAFAQPARGPGLHNAALEVDGVGTVTYGLRVPRGYDAADPRPLVVALHPGGSPGPGYGMQFLRSIVAPALDEWGAVVVSPDAPGRRWNNETSESGVLALIDDVRARYAVDPDRILVTGFSMGGRGTWYLAARHPDLFTAAVPMAARSDADEARRVGDMPVFIIHARDDEVVPFGPAERTAQEMEARGQTVSFLPLEGVGHFRMGVAPLRTAGDWVRGRWAER